MKLRILFVALLTVLVASSVALAKGGPDKPDASVKECRMVGIVLKGTFLSGGTDSFQMDVKHANRHGRAVKGARELKVDAKTRFRRDGKPATLASLQANDRLHVKARGCKPAQAKSLELLAKKVTAKAPKAAPSTS